MPEVAEIIQNSFSDLYDFLGMEVKDVYKLLSTRFRYELYLNRLKRFVFKRSFRYLFTNAFDRGVFVAEFESANTIAGVAVISNVIDDVWNLDMLAVSPNFRSIGVGAKLTKAAISYVKEKGGKRIHVEVLPNNTPAIKLYHKFGFASTGPVDHMKVDI